jgi:hypothetical protein
MSWGRLLRAMLCVWVLVLLLCSGLIVAAIIVGRL